MTRSCRASTIAAIGAAALIGAAPGAALPRPGERWIRVDTEHFDIFSSARRSQTVAIGRDLEELRATLAALAPETAALPAARPTAIYVFANDRAFDPYKPRYFDRPASLAGYFLAHAEGNYMALDGDPGVDPRRIVYHEYLHEVMRGHRPSLPLWLEEGLAELYSTFETDGSTARIGLPIVEHVAVLRRAPLMPLEELFAVDRDHPSYNESSRQSLFYAQSWLLAHYLAVADEARRARLPAFFEMVRTMPVEQALARVFDLDPATLLRHLTGYARSYQLVFLTAPGAPPAERPPIVRPLSRVEVLYRLGDLLAHGDQPHQAMAAEEHFRAALALDPNHAPSLAGLGWLRQRAGDLEGALAALRRAAALDTGSDAGPGAGVGAGVGHCRLGHALLETLDGEALGPRAVSAAQREAVAEARAALEACVARDPARAEAWADLGFTYTVETVPPPAAARALETAVRLLPERDDVLFNLILIYGRAGRRADAETLIAEVLAPRADDQTLAAARRLMLNFEIEDLQALLAAQRLEQALPLVERLLARVEADDVRASLQAQRAEIRATLDHNRFVARYNDAVELANQGRLEEAIDALEALIATLPVGDRRDQAGVLLGALRRARVPG